MESPGRPEPLPLPLRVVVKGASTVSVKSARPDERAAFTFPRALERHLLRRGRACQVTARSVPGDPTRWILRDWVDDYLALAPDAIVFAGGHYETMHLIWPRWLERHTHSLTWRPGPIRTWYQKRFLARVWKKLGAFQREADRRLPGWLTDRRLRRVAADLAATIERIHRLNDPLILLAEVPRPGLRARTWFPGMDARVRQVNQLMADVVRQAGRENVRLFPTNAIIERHTNGQTDDGVPDGFHLTPALHDAVGAELAEIIDVWATGRPELG